MEGMEETLGFRQLIKDIVQFYSLGMYSFG